MDGFVGIGIRLNVSRETFFIFIQVLTGFLCLCYSASFGAQMSWNCHTLVRGYGV